jgi:hypothetical protein
MVWPILISVAVTPRISAEIAAAGHIKQATAPSAPNPVTPNPAAQRIGLPPLLLPCALMARFRLSQTCHGAVADAIIPPTAGHKKTRRFRRVSLFQYLLA